MDEKARKILLGAYWGPQGWKNGAVNDEDFAYCKSKNVMFDGVTLKHPDLVRRVIAARDALSGALVGRAFVASLSQRKVWLRSALGSYGNCRELTQHRFRPDPFGDMGHLCKICHATRVAKKENLSVLSFERAKWGGVRHHDLLYNFLDLELLALEDHFAPSKRDQQIFKQMLRELRTAVSLKESSSKLRKRWKPLLPSSAEELDTLVQILGAANLIEIDGYKIVRLDEELVEEYFG